MKLRLKEFKKKNRKLENKRQEMSTKKLMGCLISIEYFLFFKFFK